MDAFYLSCRHENASGFYRVSAYFLAKVLCDLIPLHIIPVAVFSVIVYFMIGNTHTHTRMHTQMHTSTGSRESSRTIADQSRADMYMQRSKPIDIIDIISHLFTCRFPSGCSQVLHLSAHLNPDLYCRIVHWVYHQCPRQAVCTCQFTHCPLLRVCNGVQPVQLYHLTQLVHNCMYNITCDHLATLGTV